MRRGDVTVWTDISTEVGLFVAAVAPTHELKLSFLSWRPCLSNPSVCWTARGPMGVLTPITSKKWHEARAKFIVCALYYVCTFQRVFSSKTRVVSVSCIVFV